MKIKAIAPWYGCKRSIAKDIVSEIGKHKAYWEPFCGSMAVLLAKPVCSHETVNDLNKDLVNLAQCIRDPNLGPKLYRRLRRRLFIQDEVHNARSRLRDEVTKIPDINRAEDYFSNSWMSINGLAGTKQGFDKRRGIARRFKSGGGTESTRFTKAVNSIPAWRRRMRDITILSDDGIVLCEKCEDKKGTVIYVDPPYIEKHGDYIHDFSDNDHKRLANALQRFKHTRVIVSYYQHESLSELYPGWTVKKIDTSKNMTNATKGKPKKAPEVLLINGPSLKKRQGFFE